MTNGEVLGGFYTVQNKDQGYLISVVTVTKNDSGKFEQFTA